MEKRTNKNYDIIQTIVFPAEEYVLGVKAINKEKEYVTWCCSEKNKYHYGHYFNDYSKAVKDLYERAKAYIDWTLEGLL